MTKKTCNKKPSVLQDEEANESDKKSEASDRDSDAEFEQMLQEAQEASPEGDKKDKEDGAEGADTPTVVRKAKTKFGVKNKRKPKKKTEKAGEVSRNAMGPNDVHENFGGF